MRFYERCYKTGFLLLVLLLLNSCQKTTGRRIAILQDKPQEWADALKSGFNDGLKEQGVDLQHDVTLVPRSASGDPQALTTIAKSFADGDYVLIYALGTQSAQEVFRQTKSKAILFGAVTDPVQAGFFNGDLTKPLGNISGSQDLWPYPAQFDLIQRLLPTARKIGIIYNSSEVNSQVSVNYIKNEAQRRGLQILERTVTAESEVQPAVSAILNQHVDVFFIPADNTAQTSSPTILGLCQQKRVPVFTGISGIVEAGALGTVGTNYYELGKVNARQAAQILKNGGNARTVPVAIADRGDIYINSKTASTLGIVIPDDLKAKAFKIY